MRHFDSLDHDIVLVVSFEVERGMGVASLELEGVVSDPCVVNIIVLIVVETTSRREERLAQFRGGGD
jgi:hypothetical protein